MLALTVWQPWATLVACGAKQVETRSWPTGYRGWLAIHAAATLWLEGYEACRREPIRSALAAAGYDDPTELPLGAVVGLVRVVNCVEIRPGVRLPDEPERSFGEYRPGRYMWLLMGAVRLERPVPARGGQRLWEWRAPEEVLELVRRRL